ADNSTSVRFATRRSSDLENTCSSEGNAVKTVDITRLLRHRDNVSDDPELSADVGLELPWHIERARHVDRDETGVARMAQQARNRDRKSTRLNSSHVSISY